jgi:hypothetical protein
MGREEQIEEREVLESIFPEEITGLSASRDPAHHQVAPMRLSRGIALTLPQKSPRQSTG